MKFRFAISAGLMTLSAMALSADLFVPSGSYPTIQSAVTAANPGDAIHVATGVYNENVVVNKRLLIEGAGSSTILNGGGGIGIRYTVGGTSAASRQILRNIQVQGAVDKISLWGDISYMLIDGVLVAHTGSQDPNLNQTNGISFFNASGTLTPWNAAGASNHDNITVSNTTFKDNYYALWFTENLTNFRMTGCKVLGGWMGFFLWNGNTADGSTTVRTTNNIRLDKNLFYDIGVKGIYLERGNNVTIEDTTVLFCGNRSNRSLPTTDPRGIHLNGNGNVGNGIDVNLCGSGPIANLTIRNTTVAYCAMRDREVNSDPTTPGQDLGLGLGAGVSIKGRIFRGGSAINGLSITNSTFAHNKIGINFPQTDANSIAGGTSGLGTTKGNVVNNGKITNCNFYANVTRAVNPEGNSSIGAQSLVFAGPTNVAVLNGYPTAGAWGTTGMQPIQMDGNNYGTVNGPASAPTSSGQTGSGDAVSDAVIVNNFLAAKVATINGRPVDLTGTYTGPSASAPGASSQPGRASASTGTAIITTQTYENSGNIGTVNGSFQPFNEIAGGKAPRLLTMPNPVGTTSFNTIVELNSPSQWVGWRWGGENGATYATGDTFNVGVNNTFNSAGVQFVKDWTTGQFRARMASENYAPRASMGDGNAVFGSQAGNDAMSPVMPGSTRFEVTCVVRAGELEGWVTPLDGTLAGQAQYLGKISKTNMNTNYPWTLVIDSTSPFGPASTYYAAGFVNHQNDGSLAHADVQNFRTSQDANNFSALAVDPYVRGTEPIDYLLGSANLSQQAYGYQGSLSASGATTMTGFDQTIYPFPQALFVPTTGSLHYAAGVAPNVPGPDFDTLLASIQFANPNGNGVASLNPLSTFLGALSARYSDVNGSPFPSLTIGNSNTVVVDNVLPTATATSLTLTPSTSISLGGSGTMIAGGYRLIANAFDGGSSPSGLNDRPTYSWDFGNNGSTEIGPTPMMSGVGNNFYADFTVLSSYTNGPAKLTINVVDRAGNATTTVVMFNVNTTTVTINFTVPTAWSGKTMWIHTRIGGNGSGSFGPYDYHRNILIGAGGAGTVVLNALNTAAPVLLPTSPNTLTQFSLKAMPYSLRVNGTLSGGPNLVGNAGTLRMGDGNGDNLVDILDYALYSVKYNTSETAPPASLADGVAPNGDGVLLPIGERRADFSGNGLVFTEDFSYFIPFPAIGDLLSGGPGSFSRGLVPQTTMTIKEAVNAGVPTKVATMMDADRNGVITLPEIDAYMRRGSDGGKR